ncbi:hypothetical protein PLESTB_000394400 [Pleodorina starrii]|uniref:BACK domain-containing protein n=1 Tax=Pleodorina starrii TaxID=330485 RepID=A0A9W6BF00_9CHLO|nr:hypothetical protein PLESTB_000394400 [Pleodorina starrii]
MDTPVNGDVARAITKLFACEKDSDCVIIFYRESNAPAELEAPAKRRRLQDCSRSAREVLGEPLPGHQLVLRYASDLFAAQVKWITENPSAQQPAKAAKDGGSPAPRAKKRAGNSSNRRGTQLHVPLRSEQELPAARAAVAFAYTGEVQVEGGIRAVLEVRRQGAYLQMRSCAAACDKRLVEKLQAGGAAAPPAPPAGDPDRLSAVLELYACAELWPDPELEPSFAAVLHAARAGLAGHFRDALAALNVPSLRAQLLGLPADCLAALLHSETFGADCESSVLLLLATWVGANQGGAADARARARLCRLLRLLHLSRPYPHLVLPALAADHESSAANHESSPAERDSSTAERDSSTAERESPAADHESSAVGWFPLSVVEAAYLCGLATASEPERSTLLNRNAFAVPRLEAQPPGPPEPPQPPVEQWQTYNPTPRPQCLPAGGLTFTWHISQGVLKRALADLQPGKRCFIPGTFDGGLTVVSAWGLEWATGVRATGGQQSATPYVKCQLPRVLAAPGSRLDGFRRPSPP